MKIIITGATGFIGSVTLNKALEHPSITKVVAYTRRPLQHTHSKLENIVQDSLELPVDPSPCIWCAGAKLGVPIEDAKALEDAALAAAERTGRFIYLSGMLAVRDQTQSLWFAEAPRRLKGLTETSLLRDGKNFIMRPSMVVQGWKMPMTIRVEDLAIAMVELAVNGNTQTTWENSELVKHAQQPKRQAEQ